VPKIRSVCNLKHNLIAGPDPLRFSCCVSKHWIFVRDWLPTLLWMGVIFSASADRHSYARSLNLIVPFLHWLFPRLSFGQLLAIHHFLRKCAHFTEYAILALLLRRTLHHAWDRESAPWSAGLLAVVLGLVFGYAASDEFHQSFVPGRTALFTDVLIDAGGGTAGLLAGWCFYRVRKKN